LIRAGGGGLDGLPGWAVPGFVNGLPGRASGAAFPDVWSGVGPPMRGVCGWLGSLPIAARTDPGGEPGSRSWQDDLVEQPFSF